MWASGFADNVNDKNLADPFVLHWNGKAWSLTKVPNPNAIKEGSRLNAIRALSPADVWAVGQTQKNNGSILTLTEQYNGSSWTVSLSPDPGMLENLVDNSLDSVGSGGGWEPVRSGRGRDDRSVLPTHARNRDQPRMKSLTPRS